MIGEVRGGEAWDLLWTLNTGHDGSLSTLHVSSACNALKRCASCVLQARIGLPYAAVQDLLCDVSERLVACRNPRLAVQWARTAQSAWGTPDGVFGAMERSLLVLPKVIASNPPIESMACWALSCNYL